VTCEVCHEPVIVVEELPPEIQDQIYRPGKDELPKDVTLRFPPTTGMGNGAEVDAGEIDVPLETPE
jgi:hypothetical protein